MEHTRILPSERVSAPIALRDAPPPPPMAVTRVLARYSRNELAGFIAVAIDLLDFVDGDADLEADDRGGETLPVPDAFEIPIEDDAVEDSDLEEIDVEDSFVLSTNALRINRGPGCEVSDAGEFASVEWHTMGGPTLIGVHEDDEDDDPSGQSDEDGINTGTATFGWGGPQGAGCPISDNDVEHDGGEPDYEGL